MSNLCAFSDCRKYRYTLWRDFGLKTGNGYCAFIGLNPSTADETQDDPTVRRCINYAKAWGYDEFCMLNIFAYRATDPNEMKAQSDPVGEWNDVHLVEVAKNASLVVAAWGVHGQYLGRGNAVAKMLPNLHYLKLTKDGYPAHPLYLPKTLEPVRWDQR